MINSFEIKRYRCFASASASNLSRVNVIVGQSGSGKTALLEALWLCAGGNPQHYFSLLSWRGIIGSQFRLETETYDQFFRDMFYRFETERGIEIRLEDVERGAWALEIGPDQEIGQRSLGGSPETGTHTAIAFISKTPSGQPFKVPIQFGQGGEIQFPRSPNPYQVVFLNNTTLPNAGNVTSRFSQIVQDGREDKAIEALNKLYPNITDVRLISYAGGNVLLATVEGLGRIPISSVSGGVNKYLTLLITLGTQRRSVVLLDEFENGFYYANLTDAWRGLVGVCRETESQIFLTTHSHECLMALLPVIEETPEDFTLIRTERQDGEVLPVQFSGEEMRASLKQHFEIR